MSLLLIWASVSVPCNPATPDRISLWQLAGSATLREDLKKAMGGCSAPAPADPEFYLRLRDLVLRRKVGRHNLKVRHNGAPR